LELCEKAVDKGVTGLIVSNLPTLNGNGNNGRVQVRARLLQLGSNCRGRVVHIMHDGRALIRFPNREAMLRSVIVRSRGNSKVFVTWRFWWCLNSLLLVYARLWKQIGREFTTKFRVKI